MKSEVYIFGNFSSGYSQYPDDYTNEIFREIGKKRSSESELVFQRRGPITYYTYIRSINTKQNTYLGICCVFNGVLIRDIDSLFSIFEEFVCNVVLRGDILEFTDNGKISTNVDYLYLHEEELQRISDYLNVQLSLLSKSASRLPAPNLSISLEEWKTFVYTEREDINSAFLLYSNIRVIKGENYDNEKLTSYSGKLYKLNQEKVDALKLVDKQKQEISDLKKSQKNYKLVIILIVFIFIVLIVGLNFISDKNHLISDLKNNIENLDKKILDQKNDIDLLESKIRKYKDEILTKEREISVLNEDLSIFKDSLLYSRETINQLSTELKEKEAEIQRYKKNPSMYDNIPIYIKNIEMANTYSDGTYETRYGNTIYSSYTMYLKPKITYVGINSNSRVTLKVKLYTPSGTLSTGSSSPTGASYSDSFTVGRGENTQELSGWGNSSKGHWGKGKYRIEVWYNDMCLKTKSFTIY